MSSLDAAISVADDLKNPNHKPDRAHHEPADQKKPSYDQKKSDSTKQHGNKKLFEQERQRERDMKAENLSQDAASLSRAEQELRAMNQMDALLDTSNVAVVNSTVRSKDTAVETAMKESSAMDNDMQTQLRNLELKEKENAAEMRKIAAAKVKESGAPPKDYLEEEYDLVAGVHKDGGFVHGSKGGEPSVPKGDKKSWEDEKKEGSKAHGNQKLFNKGRQRERDAKMNVGDQ